MRSSASTHPAAARGGDDSRLALEASQDAVERRGALCIWSHPGQGGVDGHADSLLTICLAAGDQIEITGGYEPAWKGIEGNHLLLPDETGGVATYLIGDGKCERPASWKAGWKVRYRAASGTRLLVSVFPPRPFDWKQSGETMVHSFSCNRPYPTDEELTAWRRSARF